MKTIPFFRHSEASLCIHLFLIYYAITTTSQCECRLLLQNHIMPPYLAAISEQYWAVLVCYTLHPTFCERHLLLIDEGQTIEILFDLINSIWKMQTHYHKQSTCQYLAFPNKRSNHNY